MAKKKPLNDDQIAALLENRVAGCVSFADSKLSREREQVLRYYNGELPRPFHPGNSRYVSADVYDSVESMKATLLETFSGNTRPVRFAPQGFKDALLARTATEYVNFVVFRQNQGFQTFHDVIHNGLVARVGIVKVYWEKIQEPVEDEITGATEDEFLTQVVDPEVTEIKDQILNDDGTYNATLVRMKDQSKVTIEVVPPEEFIITARAKHIRDADIVGQKTRRSQSELIKQFPEKKRVIEDLASNDELWIETEGEVAARHEGTEASTTIGLENDAMTPDRRKIDVYEVYAWLDADAEGVSRLWKVTMAAREILHKQRVDRVPYKVFVPLPVPHAFHGNNFAARVIPTQNARTVLMRGILDHTVMTNNPRYMVVRGGLLNPKELMENRVGGIVNVTRPDAVVPIPQTGLNPFVFQSIQLLDEDKEESTGISKLSSGLNKDAISKQNSADMVGQMVSLSQQRQKIIARQFAEGFLKELWLEVYQLVLENESGEKVIEVAGEYVPVTPSQWSERTDVEVEFCLGYGEKEREAQKFLQLDMVMAQDPRLEPMYPLEKRYNTYTRALEAMGIKDVGTFLVDPSTLPPPDPMQNPEVQLAFREQARKEAETQTKAAKVQVDAQTKATDLSLKQAKVMGDLTLEDREQDRADVELQHNMAMDEQEMALSKQAQETRAIFSPDNA
jgi:hypothetical protein